MALKNQDFEMWKGNNKELLFTVEDVANLDGSISNWAVSKAGQKEKLFVKTVVNSEGKIVTIPVLPEDTEDLPPGNYYHELEIIDGVGSIFTAAIGQMRLYPKIN